MIAINRNVYGYNKRHSIDALIIIFHVRVCVRVCVIYEQNIYIDIYMYTYQINYTLCTYSI